MFLTQRRGLPRSLIWQLQVPRLQACPRSSKKDSMKRFLQINLHCAKATQGLMCQTTTENDIDYTFASEYHSLGEQHWYPNADGKAAIICGPSILVSDIGQSESVFHWVVSEGLIIYSCYWSLNTTFREYEQFLRRLERSVRGRNTET